jgi:hypothetical protein
LISATRIEHAEQLCLRRLRRQVGPRSLDAHRCPTEDREPDQADHARHEDDAGDELLDRAAAADPPGTAVGIEYLRAELFGSLGAAGHGHGSVRAVVLGLEGDQPDLVDSVGARLLGPRGTPLQGLARHLRRPRQLGVTDDDLNIQSYTDRGRGRRRGRVGGAARRHDGAVRG